MRLILVGLMLFALGSCEHITANYPAGKCGPGVVKKGLCKE